jgi:hypothetical protein
MTTKTIFMPKADAELVLAVLRDPANKQGHGALFDKDANNGAGGYCCLGLMQCAKTGGRVEAEKWGHGNVSFRGFPTLDWLNSVGWRFEHGAQATVDPYLPTLGCTASKANDQKGKTFAEIADAMEACIEYTD